MRFHYRPLLIIFGRITSARDPLSASGQFVCHLHAESSFKNNSFRCRLPLGCRYNASATERMYRFDKM